MHRRIDVAAIFLNFLQMAFDVAGCLGGFALAFWLYSDTSVVEEFKRQPHAPHSEHYYLISIAFTSIVILYFMIKGLYQSRETGLMNMDEATGVLQGLFFASAFVIGGSYFFSNPPTSTISRLIVGLSVGIGSFFVLAGRALGYKLRRYLQQRGHFFRRVVICGAGEMGRAIARKLLHSPKFHILPVAFLDNDTARKGTSIHCLSNHESLPVAGRIDDLEAVLEKFEAQEVWIALPGGDQDQIIEIAQTADFAGVPCRFVPNLFQVPLERLTVDSMGGVPLLSIKPRATVRPMPMWKRVFDVIFSLIVLVASLPLWPLLILLIRATTHGPAFFTQERIGQGGRAFRMFKFRTMYADAPAYATTPAHPRDCRITPLGRWLRKLSVDELPQFWNVLVGDMSVVGPRPEMPQIVAQYNAIQRQRLCVKPGITGVWQISADRKNPIHENIDYDLYYIEKQSFFLDLMIILTTGVYGARGV